MVHIYIHHRSSLNFVCEEYVGGEVVDLGVVDPDYISTTVFHEYAKGRPKFPVSLIAESVDIVGATEGGYISRDIDAHDNSMNDEAEVQFSLSLQRMRIQLVRTTVVKISWLSSL
ncbi:hypothetical protein CJ030_MR0G004767 [Morella rubra]|uniref:Uncharacterized protein n=1 Tax=Morella rubra TaxID=262757 RepID=A0A6A1ULM2_9ROSI|nr:hypothetical protein CJ030_MR0G004767 [Morella rubra]